MNYEHLGVIEMSLDDLRSYGEADWTNYPKGVKWTFSEMSMKLDVGLDLFLVNSRRIPESSR